MLIAFVIGISRLYLGAHWLSDVLGGYFIGASCAAAMGIAYLSGADDIIPRRLLGLAVVLVILIAGGWHVARQHEKDSTFYALRRDVRAMPLSAWQSGGWRDLPAWRIDMEGELEQPLTIQWVGSPDVLQGYLISRGWRQPAPLNTKLFLGMFAPNTPVADLPILP
jgi:undecaprenyl-diphosphatase